MEEGEGRKWSSKGEEGSRWRKLGGGGLTGRGSGACVGWGREEVEHDMGPWGGKDSCCKRGADMRGVCDGLIGAFHGCGGGYAEVHVLCTFSICAYLSALLSLLFILDFL